VPNQNISKSADVEIDGAQASLFIASNDARHHQSRRLQMQYILMTYVPEDGWTRMTKAEQERGMAAYTAFTEALAKAGVLKGSGRLQQSSTATTVRIANGKPQVLDGPYADTKEQFGGYFIIDVDDLDAALAWAARCPAADHGVVEVRPLWASPA
jgi:hypothetical protein